MVNKEIEKEYNYTIIKEVYAMPQIIPIKDLKNTSEISDMCHKTEGPGYIWKRRETYLAKVSDYEAVKGLRKAHNRNDYEK